MHSLIAMVHIRINLVSNLLSSVQYSCVKNVSHQVCILWELGVGGTVSRVLDVTLSDLSRCNEALLSNQVTCLTLDVALHCSISVSVYYSKNYNFTH